LHSNIDFPFFSGSKPTDYGIESQKVQKLTYIPGNLREDSEDEFPLKWIFSAELEISI
jgi:hypothetical protein